MKSLKEMFARKSAKAGEDVALENGDLPLADELAVNDAAAKKQRMILAGVGLVGLVAGSAYIFSGNEEIDEVAKSEFETKIATDQMVNRNMAQQEWMAMSESQMASMQNQMRGAQGQQAQIEALQAQIASSQAERQSMANDGQRVVTAYQTENEQLRAALQAAQRAPAPAPAPGPTAMYGRGSPPGYAPPAPAGAGATTASLPGSLATPAARLNQVKMVSFGPEGGGGTGTRIAGGNTSYTDSPNYLPPNSIAKAKVIVGVDASAGVNSQTDPLPVVLRIVGPARSVYRNGQLLTTRIEGCLVNGAARGDLSSEKVYVKLQRMTCPQENGRYAVSDVKGFLAFGGKTGIRGRVVSREGGLLGQAFLAGLVGGIGNAFSNTTRIPYVAGGGEPKLPSATTVGVSALGGGAAEAGKNVSQYLIERAEQYQPVIEMPTGIEVEIVFLEGVFIQN